MTGDQLQAVLKAFDTFAESTGLHRDRIRGVSIYSATFESLAYEPIEGRSNEEAVLQVVSQIRTLARELEDIGV